MIYHHIELIYRPLAMLAGIGGGPGAIAISARRNVPGLMATNVESGLGDRVSVLAGDVAAAPPDVCFDAAVVRSVIQVLSPDNARALLRHIGQAMEPGGQGPWPGDRIRSPCDRRPGSPQPGNPAGNRQIFRHSDRTDR